ITTCWAKLFDGPPGLPRGESTVDSSHLSALARGLALAGLKTGSCFERAGWYFAVLISNRMPNVFTGMNLMTEAFRGFWFRLVAGCAVLFLFSVGATGGEAPIRVALVGLVHGHAKGFLRALPGNDSATLVAVVEPREDLAKEYAAKFGLDSKLFYTDLERMLAEQHPDAVLVYTAIADHRKVIETAARHGVSSMVEKPVAGTLDAAVR